MGVSSDLRLASSAYACAIVLSLLYVMPICTCGLVVVVAGPCWLAASKFAFLDCARGSCPASLELYPVSLYSAVP